MAPFVAPSQTRSIPQAHAYQHQQHRFYQPLAEGTFQLPAPSPLRLTNPMAYQNQAQHEPQPHSRSEITYPHFPQANTTNNDTTESNTDIAYSPFPNTETQSHDPSPTPIPNPDLPHPNPYWPTHDLATIGDTLGPTDKTYGIAVDREDKIYFTTGRPYELISFPYFIRVDLPLGARAGVNGVQNVSFTEFKSKAAEMARVLVSGDAPPPMPRIGDVICGYSWDLERGEVLRGVGNVTGVGRICFAVVDDEEEDEEEDEDTDEYQDEGYSEGDGVNRAVSLPADEEIAGDEEDENEHEAHNEDSEEEGEIRGDYFPDLTGKFWGRDTYFGFKPSLGFR
ncbi:hypothetical protein BDV19DRAFT_386832 [Aspergillus venezuelensis]